MTSIRPLVGFLAALGAACGTAHADRIAVEPGTGPILPLGESPYRVDLIDQSGASLDTYAHRGRFYVHGDSGDRYSIRITNPTPRRVEAVVSVDGLDVIDGETASLQKRGYVIPAGGTVTIDGFRVSTRQVAAFRFSSVSSSYAGRKGKARNVGVIGVALFAERSAPSLVMPEGGPRPDVTHPAPPPRPRKRSHVEREPARDYDLSDQSAGEAEAGGDATSMGGVGGAPPRTRGRSARRTHKDKSPRHRRERPGLGTAFGERRWSAVTWTRFVRESATPTAMAELRYNDADGLEALGIDVRPAVDEDELITRETANPFPGSRRRFALPPR